MMSERFKHQYNGPDYWGIDPYCVYCNKTKLNSDSEIPVSFNMVSTEGGEPFDCVLNCYFCNECNDKFNNKYNMNNIKLEGHNWVSGSEYLVNQCPL